MLSQQGERTFSEEEEQKLQAALGLDKHALSLMVETAAFILEQVMASHTIFKSSPRLSTEMIVKIENIWYEKFLFKMEMSFIWTIDEGIREVLTLMKMVLWRFLISSEKGKADIVPAVCVHLFKPPFPAGVVLWIIVIWQAEVINKIF